MVSRILVRAAWVLNPDSKSQTSGTSVVGGLVAKTLCPRQEDWVQSWSRNKVPHATSKDPACRNPKIPCSSTKTQCSLIN